LLIALRWLAKNDFALSILVGDWQCLQHDIEAFAIRVRKHGADREPEIILPLSFDYRVDAMCRLLVVSHH
jgi:hypothetical protein